MPRPTDQIILSGTQSAATIAAGTPIEEWDPVAGMTYSTRWMGPEFLAGSTPPERAAREEPLDGSAREHGMYTWQWVFPILLDVQWNYWLTTFLTAPSVAVSVMDYATDNSTAIYLNAKAHRPQWGRGLERVTDAGYRVTIRFTNGKVAS